MAQREPPRLGSPARIKAVAIETDPDALGFLPGCQFADAYAIAMPQGIDAPSATSAAFRHAPGWIRRLLGLRNSLVALAGLKPAPPGGFPILVQTADMVVLGFDDRHLDFRIVVTVAGACAVLTTLVRWHNAWGHAYLCAVMPYHRLIAPRMLEGAVQP